MTIEEKLKIAVDFIKKIESMEFTPADVEDAVTVHARCPNCHEDVDYEIYSNGAEYVDMNDIESLKHDAWHTLVDLTD